MTNMILDRDAFRFCHRTAVKRFQWFLLIQSTKTVKTMHFSTRPTILLMTKNICNGFPMIPTSCDTDWPLFKTSLHRPIHTDSALYKATNIDATNPRNVSSTNIVACSEGQSGTLHCVAPMSSPIVCPKLSDVYIHELCILIMKRIKINAQNYLQTDLGSKH